MQAAHRPVIRRKDERQQRQREWAARQADWRSLAFPPACVLLLLHRRAPSAALATVVLPRAARQPTPEVHARLHALQRQTNRGRSTGWSTAVPMRAKIGGPEQHTRTCDQARTGAQLRQPPARPSGADTQKKLQDSRHARRKHHDPTPPPAIKMTGGESELTPQQQRLQRHCAPVETPEGLASAAALVRGLATALGDPAAAVGMGRERRQTGVIKSVSGIGSRNHGRIVYLSDRPALEALKRKLTRVW